MTRIDPPSVHAAATGFGKLVAQQVMTNDDCMPYLMRAAKDKGYSGDETGLYVRLSWSINDSVADWNILAFKAQRAIRNIVSTLFDLSASGAEIQTAAVAANERFGEPLGVYEIIAILRDELQWWRRRTRHRSRMG